VNQKTRIGWITAASLVVANMIGTGVFTSLGFQLEETQNSWSIVLLWSLGGLVALAGAFSYAELGAYFQRSGGEYLFLSKIFHPLVGYLSGWISLTVGFAAPVALAAMAMGSYTQSIFNLDARITATIVVIMVTAIHSVSLGYSSRFQNVVTVLKVVLIAGFVIAGFVMAPAAHSMDWSENWKGEILMPAFVVSLIFVTFSYTGWNAAAYIVEEIREVKHNLPKALLTGTLTVTVLYVLLQLVFLKHATLSELAGQVEVGQVVAENMFGLEGGKGVSLSIALFLVSSISAMVWVGPRVTRMMAEDYGLWRFLKKNNRQGIPVRAIWFQTGISLVMVWTGTFEQVLVYCGFILLLSGATAVLGTFFINRKPGALPYRNPTHPWLPAIFILVSLWILSFLVCERPMESLLGLSNLGLGLLTYFASKGLFKNR
jgi:APA family basic amino acid/polyamine antiporter